MTPEAVCAGGSGLLTDDDADCQLFDSSLLTNRVSGALSVLLLHAFSIPEGFQHQGLDVLLQTKPMEPEAVLPLNDSLQAFMLHSMPTGHSSGLLSDPQLTLNETIIFTRPYSDLCSALFGTHLPFTTTANPLCPPHACSDRTFTGLCVGSWVVDTMAAATLLL